MEDRLDPKDLLSSRFSVTCRTVGISAELTYNPVFEDRNIFEMMIRRSFGEITLELTAEQFARLNR